MLDQTILIMQILVLFSGILLIMQFVSLFEIKKQHIALFLFPLFVFTSGYSMRFTETKNIVDLGYFFTDFSFLFVYLLFASALILGQLKYWKK